MSNPQNKRSTDSNKWGSAVIGIVVAVIGISLFSDGSPWHLVLVTVGGLCLAASAAWAGIRERNYEMAAVWAVVASMALAGVYFAAT